MSSRYGRSGGDEAYHGDSSPPPSYYSSRASSGSRSPAPPGGNTRGGGEEEDDIYNYEVGTGSRKGSSGGGGKKKKKDDKKSSSKPSTPEVRKSTEERIAEIMARHGVSSPVSSAAGVRASLESVSLGTPGTMDSHGRDEDEPSSFRDFARDLMQLRSSLADSGVDSSQENPVRKVSNTPVAPVSPVVTPPRTERNRRTSVNSDSSDISEGDFEAGGYAKRVQQRKKEQREQQQHQQMMEQQQERKRAMLAASPPPSMDRNHDDLTPPPSASRLDSVPERPPPLDDFDDMGLVRYGSPAPSYDSVDPRTPGRDGGGGHDVEPSRSYGDDFEDNQTSGGESVSPLYRGDVPGEGDARVDSRSLDLDLSASSPFNNRNGARDSSSRTKEADHDDTADVARQSGSRTPVGSGLTSAFSVPTGLRIDDQSSLHLTPLSSQGGLHSMAYSADTEDDEEGQQHGPLSVPLSGPLSAVSPSPQDAIMSPPPPLAAPAPPSPAPPQRQAQTPNSRVDTAPPPSLSPPPPPIGGAPLGAGRAPPPPVIRITALPPSSGEEGDRSPSRQVAASPYDGGPEDDGEGPPSSSSPGPPPTSFHDDDDETEKPMTPPPPPTIAPPPPPEGQSPGLSIIRGGTSGTDCSEPGEEVALMKVVVPSEVSQSLRLLKGHSVTRVADAQSFPGRDQQGPTTVLLRGEGTSLRSPGQGQIREEDEYDGDQGEEETPLQERRRRGKLQQQQQPKRQVGGTGPGRSAAGAGRSRSPGKSSARGSTTRQHQQLSQKPSVSRETTPSRATARGGARKASSKGGGEGGGGSEKMEREAEQMEREALLYEWERALEERVMRLELQEKLLTKKELAVDKTSQSLKDMQGSLEQEIRAAAVAEALPTSTGEGGVSSEEVAAKDEMIAKLKEEVDAARNEAVALRTDLESLRLRWDYIAGIDGVLKSAAAAATTANTSLRSVRISAAPASATGAEMVMVSVSDLTALRRDHEAQERLLEGFQKENERLLQQMTDMKHQVQRDKKDMGKEREAYNKEINNLKNQLLGSGHATHSDSLQSGLRAEAQLRYLEEDIARERKANHERELELRYEMDRLRRAKMDAELRAEGISRSVLEEGDKEVARLDHELREERERHASEVQAYQDKLRWYAENQELLEDNAILVSRQAEEISVLKKELQEARGARGGKSVPPRQEAMEKRIKELEKQLVEMEAAMQKKNPDSLANLIRAAKTDDEREAELKGRIRELEEEVKRQKESTNVMLRSLRQEHEKVKLGYEERLKKKVQERSGKGVEVAASRRGSSTNKAAGGGEPAAPSSKVKELEKELERVRNFYTRKLRETERKAETQLRALKRGKPTAPSQPPPPTKVEPAIAIEDQPLPVTSGPHPFMRGEADEMEEERRRRLEAAEAEVQSLRNALEEKAQELAAVKESAKAARGSTPEAVTSNSEADAQKSQAKAIEEAVTKLLEKVGGGRVHEEAGGGAPAVLPPGPEVTSLRQAHESLKQEVMHKDEQLASLRDGLGQLRSELDYVRSQQQHQQQQSQSRGVAMGGVANTHYQALAAQVISLERRAANRERELSEIIETSASKHQLQMLLVRTEYEQQLAEKDEQIRAFREELDSLLQALESLRGGHHHGSRRRGGAEAGAKAITSSG